MLGDRIRLNSVFSDKLYVRSMATRGSNTELCPSINEVANFLKTQDFDLIIIETSGIGQASDQITQVADKCLYVMTPEYGAGTQLEKIEMLESADAIVINKFDRPNSMDAMRDVRKQYRRNHFAEIQSLPLEEQDDEHLPVFGCIASKFNDQGVNSLFIYISKLLSIKFKELPKEESRFSEKFTGIIPANRKNYLAQVVTSCRTYNKDFKDKFKLIETLDALEKTKEVLKNNDEVDSHLKQLLNDIGKDELDELDELADQVNQYQSGSYSFKVRNKEIKVNTKYSSLSGLKLPVVAAPKIRNKASLYYFMRSQNLPGNFPFATGVFPFKRKDENPKRQFAGEGGPLRTNKRFHYLSKEEKFKRLSTAFDSVTLYGEDPHKRPDIYGKIGESGVSIAHLEDMQDLFKEIDLVNEKTSVSMTINGPAAIILAMFMNAAIRQNLTGQDEQEQKKRIEIMRKVRGTVQADILKEDQAQNTCIFFIRICLTSNG